MCKALLWVILTALALPVSAAICLQSPIFAFSEALYLEQYEEARDQLDVIERERGSDMANYLSQVLQFKQAYDATNPVAQHTALTKIDHLLETRFSAQSQATLLKERVLTANMTVHAARLNLAGERLLRAIGLAKKGRQQLDMLAGEDIGSALLLTSGLYEYYTSGEHNLVTRALLGRTNQGDREHGRSVIESAVEQSPDYAFEAARSLMADVNWNRSDTCRYLPLFNQLQDSHSVSLGHRQQAIAVNLFCGYLDQALGEIERVEGLILSGKVTLSIAQEDWLFSARLYGLAAGSDSGALKRILGSLKPGEQHRIELAQFALARALDAAGERAAAVVLYLQTLDSALDDRYLILAHAYMQNPYQKTRPFESSTMTRLKFACSSGK